MDKRLGLAASFTAIVCLAVGSAGPALGSAGHPAGGLHRTIRVFEATTAHHNIDVGPAGPSIGDQSLFRARLMRNGNEVGHDRGRCTITAVDRSRCRATTVLRNGRITVDGLVSNSSRHFDLPVTRGSGTYADAQGWLHVFEISNTQAILTFHLRL
jgi:hypothetical protein